MFSPFLLQTLVPVARDLRRRGRLRLQLICSHHCCCTCHHIKALHFTMCSITCTASASLLQVLAEPMLGAVVAEAAEAARSGWYWQLKPLSLRVRKDRTRQRLGQGHQAGQRSRARSAEVLHEGHRVPTAAAWSLVPCTLPTATQVLHPLVLPVAPRWTPWMPAALTAQQAAPAVCGCWPLLRRARACWRRMGRRATATRQSTRWGRVGRARRR